MSSAFTAVDLSTLPAPQVIESLDFDTIFADMLADLIARDSTYSALVESDPAYKILEVAAYREVLLRQRVNEAAQAVMLSYADGADLDQIGANYNVKRLVVTPEDDTTIPPTPAVMESPESYRARIQLSFEGFSTAGPEGAYLSHALDADGRVSDVSVVSPAPGQVLVTVLSNVGNGVPTQDIIDAVTAELNTDDIRPLTDQVTVAPAAVVNYTISATLELFDGPDSSVVIEAAQIAAQDYADSCRKLGAEVALSGIYGALHQVGVKAVTLIAPVANLTTDSGHAPFCTAIDITEA
jgi:phage-related baseplate assembly protein